MLRFVLLLLSTTAIFDSMECLTEVRQPLLSNETRMKNERIVGDEYKKLSTLRYTKHAISNISGDHCMTDCVNNYCLTEKERVETCQVDERKMFNGPTIYYTAYRNGVRICFSKCAAGSDTFYWCYIGRGYKTDYCNPFPNEMLEGRVFKHDNNDLYDDPCIGQCAKQGKDHEWCSLQSGGLANCHSNDLTYFQYINETPVAKTKCIGACGPWGYYKNKTKVVNHWCTIKDFNPNYKKKSDYCAPGADDLAVCKHCGIFNIKRKMNIQEYIKNVENNNNNTKIMVNDSSTSIISYTYKEVRDGLRLPLIVKAIILPKHINVEKRHLIQNNIDEEAKANCKQMTKNLSDCSNYIFGNLIAYRHGGTGAFYNVVPLSNRLYPGTKKGDFFTPSVWIINERKITNYVYDFNGVIEQTIVLYYSGESYTPKAIGSYTRVLDRAVSSALWQCENIHSNDPNYGRECDSF